MLADSGGNSCSRTPIPFFKLCMHPVNAWCTYKHTGKRLTYTHLIKENLSKLLGGKNMAFKIKSNGGHMSQLVKHFIEA